MNTHQSTAIKVGLACFLGALIGAEVALQVQVAFWLGGLIGIAVAFPIGYVSYEYLKVLEAIRTACRTTINWRPGMEAVKRRSLAALATATAGLTMILIQLALAMLLGGVGILTKPPLLDRLAALFGIMIMGTSVGLIFSLAFAERVGPIFGIAWSKRVIRGLNPVVIFVYWPAIGFLILLKLLIKLGQATPWAMTQSRQAIPKWGASIKKAIFTFGEGLVASGKALVAFCRQVFILIHSEIRLLCGVDAALGATIGLWYGNALIGAVCGCLAGVLNYLVVSVWWLKLAPKT